MFTNDKVFIPEVRFELTPIEMEADLLYSFSRPEGRFINTMNKVYPDLKDILEKSQNKEEAISKCREFAEKIIIQDQSVILKAKDMIQNDWNMISDEFMTILSKHFETDWLENKDVITGYVSILPIFPRFLSKFSFCVGYKGTILQARETIAHEILHFLWFKKWKEIFPEIFEDKYESPNLVWRLSEIMDPIILQCQPEIKKLIQPIRWGYSSFKDIKIDDISMTEYFVRIYNNCVKDKKSFEESLQILWKEAQEHRNVIERF